MKTLQNYRDEVAKQYGYENWEDSHWDGSGPEQEAAQMFAKQFRDHAEKLESRVSELERENNLMKEDRKRWNEIFKTEKAEKDRLEKEVETLRGKMGDIHTEETFYKSLKKPFTVESNTPEPGPR